MKNIYKSIFQRCKFRTLIVLNSFIMVLYNLDFVIYKYKKLSFRHTLVEIGKGSFRRHH